MIIQVAEAKKLLKDIEVLHDETVTSLKAEIVKLENELLEARKANIEMAKVALDRYFVIKHLKEVNEKKDKDIDDLNASLFKVTQESMEKDKTIKALEEQEMELKLSKENKLFLLDDKGTPIKSFTLTEKLTLMEEPAKEKLEVGKWYHTTDFKLEELKELLPVGTRVEVEKEIFYPNIKKEPPNEVEQCEVKEVIKGIPNQETYISKGEAFFKEWFKIIEE